jgi:hypothetical protein
VRKRYGIRNVRMPCPKLVIAGCAGLTPSYRTTRSSGRSPPFHAAVKGRSLSRNQPASLATSSGRQRFALRATVSSIHLRQRVAGTIRIAGRGPR